MNHFPFSAIVGLELAKRALLYHAIDSKLSGVLLFGGPGCAKSTLARGFGQLLGADIPFVEIPLGVSEDRLLGSVDAERLVEHNQWQAKKSLLGAANGGVLYVDEINLLHDSLTDAMLDAAASGTYSLERDGISAQVQARFMLLGSMNPEEGDLRPQLSDRFAHGVFIQDQFRQEQRQTILQNRLCFDDQDSKFLRHHQEKDQQLKNELLKAKNLLKNIPITPGLLAKITQCAQQFKVSGLRTEIAVLRTARAAAAFKGQTEIGEIELQEAWQLSLGHRQNQPNASPPPQTWQPPPAVPATEPAKEPASSTNPNTKPPAQPMANLAKPTPKPKPNSRAKAETEQNNSQKNTLQTSLNPTTAQQQAVFLPPTKAQPDLKLLDLKSLESKLKTQLNHADKKSPKGLGSFNSRHPAEQINWLKTTIDHCSQPRWVLHWRQPRRRPRLFMLLDASRSSGASQFLQSIQADLLNLCQVANYRFGLLLLANNQIQWICQKASATQMQAGLNRVQQAQGTSFLHQALSQFWLKLKRQPLNTKDRLWFVSDGLFTLSPEQDFKQAKTTFRRLLQQLSTLPAPLIWLHPPPIYGQPKVWQSLAAGLQLQLIQSPR